MPSGAHDIILVKRSLHRIVVWLSIFGLITATDLAEAGPFRDFFTALRSAIAHPNEKPRRHRTSHKHNETPPSDASNNQSAGTPTSAPPGLRNVRMAKAASAANQEKTNQPHATPLPGKQGLVPSPFAPVSANVDVPGFPQATT